MKTLNLNTWLKFFFGLTLCAALLYFVVRRGKTTKTNLTPADEARKAIKNQIKDSELWPFVLAQWKFETGNFQSSLFQRAANASGMRIASQRKQVLVGETNGYAKYKDLEQCAEDLQLWFEARKFPKVSNLYEYVNELKQRRYFSADLTKYYNGTKTYFDNA